MTKVTQRLASLHDSREAFFKALKTHEHSIYQIGYEDGFSAGWDAAVSRLSETRPPSAGKGAGSSPRDIAEALQPQHEETPARDTLLAIIERSPGLLRQEIVASARGRISSLNERTVRTALHRMKCAGELLVEDNRWYVAEKQKGGGANQSAG